MRRSILSHAPAATAAAILLAWLAVWLVEADGPHGAAPQRAISPPPESSAGPATIVVVGDLLPIDDRDYFTRLGSLVASADFAVGNLECPISTHGARTELKLTPDGRPLPNEYLFRAPPRQAQRLAEAGFDAVTIANNHIMDYGPAALNETLSVLDAAGITHAGAGPNRAAAREPVLATVNGQRIAVLAYVDAATLPATTGFAAADNAPGAVFVYGDASGRPRAHTADLLRADIGAARRRADFVIVCFHWGTEAKDDPDPLQRNLAHLAIEAGADLVAGSHPHVLQGVEIYHGRPIAYSLGNFAFPTPWEANQYTAALEVEIEDGQWTKLEWRPVRIEHGAGIPAPAEGDDRRRIMSRLRALSEALGASYHEGGGAAPLWLERPVAGEDAFGIEPHSDLEGMATVTFPAWDLDGGHKVTRTRSVVVAQELAEDVLAIFREIYEDEERFPIHEVIGYDYRTIAGSQDRLSFHALGRAIDINRAENPMIRDGRKIVHPDEPPYEPGEWRPDADPYSIPASGSVVRAFTSRGWRWGGTWTSCKDYQHFDKP